MVKIIKDERKVEKHGDTIVITMVNVKEYSLKEFDTILDTLRQMKKSFNTIRNQ